MTVDPRTPVIVGAGQHVHRAASIDEGVEPVALMAEAVRAAGEWVGQTVRIDRTGILHV